jgi:hypothetical protein
MPPDVLSRDAIYERFVEQLPFPLYPMQEEALLAWFASEQGGIGLRSYRYGQNGDCSCSII